MLNLFHDRRLCRSAPVRFRRTHSEIGEQRELSISAFTIEVSTYQISRLLVGWKKDVMGSDMPDCKEAVPSVPDRPTPNFETLLSGSQGRHSHNDCNIKKLNPHSG